MHQSGSHEDDAARIQRRIRSLSNGVNTLIEAAANRITAVMPSYRLRYENSGPGRDSLTPYERAQSINFATRYLNLQTRFDRLRPLDSIRIIQQGEAFFPADFDVFRAILNDYRPIVKNKKDSVFYHNVHRVWRTMLTRQDPVEGTTVRALDDQDEDVTAVLVTQLDQRNKAITTAIRSLSLDYLYNGILQHADQDLSQQFLSDYTSGNIHYIFLRHIQVLSFVQDWLRPYCRLIQTLASPPLGGL